MKFAALIFSAAMLLAPLAAHADCEGDFAKVNADAKATGLDTTKPRIKALVEKAQKAKDQKDERSCSDAIKGLNLMMGKKG
ncbi:MAG: hypothetical protein KGO53_07540 [Alphaproteobacteria bacterium]|nr:hypothetical protein [Alphaproteobacteria bacterium]